MCSNRYRLVLWVDDRHAQSAPYGAVLYDLKTDPEEDADLAKRPDYATLVGKLSTRRLEHVAKGRKG